MLAVAAGASSIGTGVQVFGQGSQARDQYIAQQKKANRVIIDSQFKVNDIERTRIRTVASQRASYAASGVKLSGSPLELMAETNYLAGVDKARTQYEARVTAEEIRAGAKADLSAARYGMVGALVGGVGKAVGAGGQGAALSSSIK